MEDLRALNCLRPTIVLRVSQHVNEIQAFISNLISRDLAYVTKSGSVYFNSQKFKLEPFIAQTLGQESDPKAKGEYFSVDFMLSPIDQDQAFVVLDSSMLMLKKSTLRLVVI